MPLNIEEVLVWGGGFDRWCYGGVTLEPRSVGGGDQGAGEK
jgi:hypothetical protein